MLRSVHKITWLYERTLSLRSARNFAYPSDMSCLHQKPMGRIKRSQQRGVVLLIALIVLIAMTLAGVALIRSTATTNLIAGNLAFHQSATSAADIGVERALAWLIAAGATLNHDQIGDGASVEGRGYSAGGSSALQDPHPNENWSEFWRRMESEGRTFPSAANATPDSAGNRSFYMIQRLCDNPGPPNTGSVRCAQPPLLSDELDSHGGGMVGISTPQVYYRITVRVLGPRNTASYVQTVVAI